MTVDGRMCYINRSTAVAHWERPPSSIQARIDDIMCSCINDFLPSVSPTDPVLTPLPTPSYPYFLRHSLSYDVPIPPLPPPSPPSLTTSLTMSPSFPHQVPILSLTKSLFPPSLSPLLTHQVPFSLYQVPTPSLTMSPFLPSPSPHSSLTSPHSLPCQVPIPSVPTHHVPTSLPYLVPAGMANSRSSYMSSTF